MRIWFDTEFLDDGKTIDLLSIGMIREDGKTYYAESDEANLGQADGWVKENVLPHLNGDTKSRTQIAQEISEFAGELPEFWAYYAAYDWVALCQLYGKMVWVPMGWPYLCMDVKQFAFSRGFDKAIDIENRNPHNALSDAIYTKHLWEHINKGTQ